MRGKARWRLLRFEVAGISPDEAARAVSNIYAAVNEVRELYIDAGYGRTVPRDIVEWLARRPLRYGNNAGADVQRFLAQGVAILDRQGVLLSGTQRQVRERCNEMSKSMEGTLAERPDDWHRGLKRGRGRSL